MYIVTFGGINTARKISMKKNPYHITQIHVKPVPYGNQSWSYIIHGKVVICSCNRLCDMFSVTVDNNIVYSGSWKAFVSGKKPMREFAMQKIVH